MLPYSGQISYNDIRNEFGGGISNFDLQNAFGGTYGPLNPYSYIQPIDPGGANYSPSDWYGYDGLGWVTSNLFLLWDAWPVVGSYPGFGTSITNGAGVPPYDGTLYNGTSWNGAIAGGTFETDGIDDYIGVNTGFGITDFSWDLWVYYIGGFNYGNMGGLATYNIDDPCQNMFLIHPNGVGASATIGFYVDNCITGNSGVSTSSALSSGTWYNLAGTYDSTNIKIYVNGTLSNSSSGGAGPNNNPNPTLILGGDPRYDFRRSNARFPVFRMYDTALTAGQVAQNWNATRGRFGL